MRTGRREQRGIVLGGSRNVDLDSGGKRGSPDVFDLTYRQCESVLASGSRQYGKQPAGGLVLGLSHERGAPGILQRSGDGQCAALGVPVDKYGKR